MSTSTEAVVARLLEIGTWVASAVIAAGVVLSSAAVVRAGVIVFIALPVARVAVLLVAFLRQRDARLAAIAALVLAVIALGVALGATSRATLG